MLSDVKSRIVNFFSAPGEPLATTYFLLLSCWFGLVTGFFEGIMLLVRRSFLLRVYSLNPHWFWMRPLMNLILFILVAGFLILIGRKLRFVLTLRFVAATFIFLNIGALLLMIPGLYTKAVLILALGFAVQMSLFISTHAVTFGVIVRRSIPWLGVVLAVMILCINIWPFWKLHRATAEQGKARPGAPNVLLLVLDTVRAQSLSLHGYQRKTSSYLESIAREGVRFEKAFSTSPWTLPSHGSMFTGRYPHELFFATDTPFNAMTPIRANYPTLADAFTEHGYATAGFVANLSYCSYAHGLSRGFGYYDDYTLSLEWFLDSASWTHEIHTMLRPKMKNRQLVSRKNAAAINQSFLDWVEGNPDRPFFAFLNYFDAHDPYVLEPGYGDLFREHDAATVTQEMNKKQVVRDLQDDYDRTLTYLDAQIGRLFAQLKNRAILENTLVIITSDHGEQFGEHGFFAHGNTLYSQALHIPLVMKLPHAMAQGLTVKQPVSLRDLAVTIIDLAGLTGDNVFPGASFARFWQDGSEGKFVTKPPYSEFLVVERVPRMWRSSWPGYTSGIQSVVLDDGRHYIRYGEGGGELYDFDRDPEEKDNLIQGEKVETLQQLNIVLNSVKAHTRAAN